MVEAARDIGASAKFTGSGGAIVGTYEDEAMFQKLEASSRAHGRRRHQAADFATVLDCHVPQTMECVVKNR